MKSVFSFMKGNILVLTVSNVIWLFALRMTFPFFSLYIRTLGGSPADIGLVNAFRALAGIFMYPIAGYAADHWGRVKVIGLSRGLFATMYLFFIFAPNWIVLAIGNFLLGVIIFHYPALSAITADSLPPERRGIGFATLESIPGYVAFVSPYVAGYLVTLYGVNLAVRYIYAFALACGVAVAIILFKFLKETVKMSTMRTSLHNIPSMIKEAYASVWEVVKWMPKNLKALALIMILSLFFNWMTASFWIIYGVDEIGLTALDWGVIMLIVSVTVEVLSIPAGLFLDKVGKRRTLIGVLAFSVLPVSLFVFCTTFLQTLAVLLTISAANAFLRLACISLMADIVPRERRGRVMAAVGRGMLFIRIQGGTGGGPGIGLLLTIPEMLGSLVSGYVYSYNPTYPWFFLAAALGLCAILTVTLVKEPETAER